MGSTVPEIRKRSGKRYTTRYRQARHCYPRTHTLRRHISFLSLEPRLQNPFPSPAVQSSLLPSVVRSPLERPKMMAALPQAAPRAATRPLPMEQRKLTLCKAVVKPSPAKPRAQPSADEATTAAITLLPLASMVAAAMLAGAFVPDEVRIRSNGTTLVYAYKIGFLSELP